jgi:hypothetical protein
VETAAAAAAAAAADAAAHTAAEALAGRGGDASAGQSASLADAAAGSDGQGAPTMVEVHDFNGRTRLHELKAHFHPFGDVVEVALMGKKV